MSYSETIQALKDFTAAKRRLDRATKEWDDRRHELEDRRDRRFRFSLWGSDHIGEFAREFLSAHNAYERLGEKSAESEVC
jgi:hypothetical protein